MALLKYTKCVYRENEIETIPCASCAGVVNAKIFSCTIHQKCTLFTKPIEGVKSCISCTDATADINNLENPSKTNDTTDMPLKNQVQVILDPATDGYWITATNRNISPNGTTKMVAASLDEAKTKIIAFINGITEPAAVTVTQAAKPTVTTIHAATVPPAVQPPALATSQAAQS